MNDTVNTNSGNNRSVDGWQRAQPAMSYDDWEALGRMGSAYSASEFAFDYNAREHTDENLQDRAEIARERQAHVLIGYRHPLNNPLREKNLTDFEAAGALWAHYARTFLQRDRKALELFGEMVRTGHKLVDEASSLSVDRRAGSHGRGDTREALLDTRTAQSAEQASDMAEEAESLANRSASYDIRNFTVVANSAAEAQVIRGMIDYALKVAPPAALKPTSIGEPSVNNMLSVEKLPSAEEFRKVLDGLKPAMFDPNRREDKRKTVALVASLGKEQNLVDSVKALPADVAVFPGINRKVMDTLIQSGDRHWRMRVDLEKKNLGGVRAVIDYNEQIIDQADQVVIAWNGDYQDVAMIAASYAARRGKLMAMVDESGRAMDVVEVGRQAIQMHKSKAEFARSMNAGVFDVAASSPEGRLGLQMIRKLPRTAANALANTDYTLNDIVEMAGSDEGRRKLVQDCKIGGVALQALTDERGITNARESAKRILAHCSETNTTIIGPETYPKSLLASGPENLPPVLYVQAQDPKAFRDVHSVVAFVGDKDLLPQTAKKASELATALDRPEVTLLQVEDQGMPRFTPENPSVLMLTSGHGFFPKVADITWKAEGKELVAQGQGGNYAIRMTEDKGFALVVSKDGQETELRKLPSKGDTVTQEIKRQAVATLKNVAHVNEQKLVNEPTITFRESIVEQGGFVVSALPPIETSSVYVAASNSREGVPSARTDESRGRACELAARTADSVVMTQAALRSPALKAVPAAVANQPKLVAMNPVREIRTYQEVEANIMMLTTPAREVTGALGIGGNEALAIAQKLGDRKIAANSGHQMNVVADKIATGLRLRAEAEVESLNRPTRKSESMER